MTQHTELTDDQTKAARWLDEVRQYLTAAADSSMSRNNSEQLAYELLEALPANALEAQAREIERLCKDAALVAARERERCANHIEDCEPPIAVHGARVEIGITTRIAYANSIRALNTEGASNAV